MGNSSSFLREDEAVGNSVSQYAQLFEVEEIEAETQQFSLHEENLTPGFEKWGFSPTLDSLNERIG